MHLRIFYGSFSLLLLLFFIILYFFKSLSVSQILNFGSCISLDFRKRFSSWKREWVGAKERGSFLWADDMKSLRTIQGNKEENRLETFLISGSLKNIMIGRKKTNIDRGIFIFYRNDAFRGFPCCISPLHVHRFSFNNG